MRIGVVGYGTGGRHFHTPFIEAAEGVTLAGVVTRSPERARAVAEDWPGVPTYASLAGLLAAGADAVSITTPPTSRRELVLEAVAAGVHVIADKPFAPTADAARELERAAAEAGVMLSVVHNRCWDADIRTLASVLEGGRPGTLWRVFPRFDADDPATLEAGPGGGLLRDIGSHVVDQMLWLLGPVRSVIAHHDWVELALAGRTRGLTIDLLHTSGVRSYLESSELNHLAVRELRAYGADGSFRASGTDVQASAIFAGRRPSEDPERWASKQSSTGACSPRPWGRRRFPRNRAAPRTSSRSSPRAPAARRRSRCRERRHPDPAGAGRRAVQGAAGRSVDLG
jgi:predicted dehydrogenase